MSPMICSDFGDTRYYLPDFDIGSVGFFYNGDELIPVKIVSRVIYADDPTAYEHYLSLPQEECNDYMKADLSCEFLTPQYNAIVGLNYLHEADINVCYYC